MWEEDLVTGGATLIGLTATHEKKEIPARQPESTMITKSQRHREILAVLARHGIGIVDDEFIKHEAGDQARSEHLRRACEELGTMFIKLGQALSTRGDLLPDAYRTELAKLQDEVAPLPASVIADVIREDLGAPPDQLFAFFDLKPLGSASIGQVHAARLLDGRDVVLKVRKPRVDELVRIDLEILAGLIDEWSPRFPVLEQYNARALLREFSDVLLAEIDYDREAANVKLFRSTFADDNGFRIPAVIEKFSKKRVLTEERAEGRKPSNVADLPRRSRTVVSRRMARGSAERAVAEAETMGRNYGVQSTPAWLLGQRLITGLRPPVDFELFAEYALQSPKYALQSPI